MAGCAGDPSGSPTLGGSSNPAQLATFIRLEPDVAGLSKSKRIVTMSNFSLSETAQERLRIELKTLYQFVNRSQVNAQLIHAAAHNNLPGDVSDGPELFDMIATTNFSGAGESLDALDEVRNILGMPPIHIYEGEGSL